MKTEKIVKIKKYLQGIGAFASAVSGVSLGLLALLRVFYPDPPQQSQVNNNTTNNKTL